MEWQGVQQRLIFTARLQVLYRSGNEDVPSDRECGREKQKLSPNATAPKAPLKTLPVAVCTNTIAWVLMRVELVETYVFGAENRSAKDAKQQHVGVFLLLHDPPSSLVPVLALDLGRCSWQYEFGADTLWIECPWSGPISRPPPGKSNLSKRRRTTVGLREVSSSAPLLSVKERAPIFSTDKTRFQERRDRHVLLNALLDEMLRSKASLCGVSERYVRAVYELVSTEAIYAADLQTILRAFLHPIRDAFKVGILPAEHANLLMGSFSNVEVLAKVHQDLLQELHGCFRAWQTPSFQRVSTATTPDTRGELPLDWVAQILLSKAFLFHLYSQYCSDFVERSENLERILHQDSAIRDFLHRCESSELCHGESLGSFLIKPVQRLTRYGLLIHKIRSEGLDRTCARELQEAERRLREIAELANRRQELAEENRRLAALCLECGGDQRIIAPGRRIIRIQDVAYLEKASTGDPSEENARKGRLVLFHDALMLLQRNTSRRRKAAFLIKWMVPIGTLTVRELHDHAAFTANDCTFLSGTETSDWLDAFEEVAAKRNPARKSWEENLSPPTHDAVEFWGAHARLRQQRRKGFR